MFRQISDFGADWEASLLAPLRGAERAALDGILSKLTRRAEAMRAQTA